MQGEAANPAEEEFDPMTLAARLAAGVLVLLGLAAVLGITLRGPLQALAEAFVAHLGLAGIFAGVLMTDSLLLTHEPLLWAGYAGGLGFWTVFVTAATASVLAGPLGWLMGTMLRRSQYVLDLFERYHIRSFLARYGLWAVAVAALTPFPFSAATWASGATGVPLRVVMLGSLFRIPKVLFYFGFIVFGWNMGS